MRFRVILILLSILCSTLSFAIEPQNKPILRIETGMHTATIGRVAADAENRFLVTGSDDKTVRIWNLDSGSLIKTLRPPISDGDEGKIYSIAISPDGTTVACGGWTGFKWDKSASVYVFDRESGRLINRITGLPNVIFNLSYSKDGRFLLASLGGNNGIRIYSTSDYSLVSEDTDYKGKSTSADFDKPGRVATASYDGFIRLYDTGFKLIAKEKAPGGENPYSVSFSPDGLKIAVGFSDSAKVAVLSGADLSFLYRPDTTGVDNGNLREVSWSSDGRDLYAGGIYQDNPGLYSIRKWEDMGRGNHTDHTASKNTIQDIVRLNDNGIIFGSAEPSFGIIDSSGKKTILRESSKPDYRDNDTGFLISNDGSTVQFGYELFGKHPARFSIIDRLLTLNPDRTDTLVAPVTSSNGLVIENWKNSYSPRVNGKAVKLEKGERSRSVAISPDQNKFLLGTEWYLRLIDRGGNEIWNVSTPSVAWAVNIAQNGKVAVAAFGDGTIRWYRMSDGKELLAFFPHNDKRRWVLWTPSGYYDASPGGEDLIGWHVNNGKENAADFFPASRFRSAYYRPNLISKVLETLDEQEALRLANSEITREKPARPIEEMLPPVIEIISPKENQEVEDTEVTIRYHVRTPSGDPVTGIKVLIDGRPVQMQKGLTSPYKGTDAIKITIPRKDTALSLLAENRYAISEPATVKVRWQGSENEFKIKPKLYILAIGVSQYESENLRLEFAAKDARDFVNLFERQNGLLYRDVATKTLLDDSAKKDEILDGLDWIQRETTSNDVAMVFISGHGVNDSNGFYYFLPANVDPNRLKTTGVPFSEIKNTIESLAGKVLFFVDTCYSGNILGGRKSSLPDVTAIVNELSSAETGVVVFASSSGRQYSLEDEKWNNGAFTKALIEGVTGKADYTKTGRITINMLDLYLSERVKELTGGRQTPTTTKPKTIADFPVAVVRN